jgi:hypothetical protein
MSMGAKPPRLDGDEIAAAVSSLSRKPFQKVLVCLLEAKPDREAMRMFAQRTL